MKYRQKYFFKCNLVISKRYSIFVCFLLNFVSTFTFAEILSPEALYYRCYAHMTRSRPGPSDTRLALVKSKKLNYVDACMQVFDLGNLDKVSGILAVETDESIKVLENFNRFHLSWFDDVNVFSALVPGGENMNHFLHDGGESALHFTRAIFHPDGNFRDAVTSNNSYQAIRSKGHNTYGIYPTTGKRADKWGTTEAVVRVGNNVVDIPITQILDPMNSHNGLHLQMGKIIGIMPLENISISGALANSASFAGVPYSESNKVSITKSFGGGLIGTQPYIMINRPLQRGVTLDGGLNSARVFGKQVFREILCREIPVIQQKDAVPLVDSLGTNNLPFRNSSSCMQCHASIDSLGWTTRDLRLNVTGSSGNGNFLNQLYFLEQYKANKLVPEVGNVFGIGSSNGPDVNFYKRPAKGHFYFRTYDGKLISKSVEGLEEVGSTIGDLDDYYACASKRYFEFFTGHKITLEDSTDLNSKKLNGKEKRLYDFVIKLGLKLHEKQKLREIVKDIISSDFYKTSDFEIQY